VGKGAARALRREGLIPAVIYGDKKPALPISIPLKETSIALHKGGFLTHIATVEVDGGKHQVIAKDFQLHPVRDELMHVDFLRVGKGTTLTVDIPVVFINEETCPGLKRGGMLNVVRHTVEMNVPATAIPESLVFDLAKADIGDTLHISATTLPEGAHPTITDRDFTVATIAAPGGGAQDDDAEEATEEEAGEE
uniref:50S ribosomal protein L25/general stress protein Ctc n=1 Tax=Roseibium sp. TaxID=1936156 RepID=UPI003A97315F